MIHFIINRNKKTPPGGGAKLGAREGVKQSEKPYLFRQFKRQNSCKILCIFSANLTKKIKFNTMSLINTRMK